MLPIQDAIHGTGQTVVGNSENNAALIEAKQRITQSLLKIERVRKRQLEQAVQIVSVPEEFLLTPRESEALHCGMKAGSETVVSRELWNEGERGVRQYKQVGSLISGGLVVNGVKINATKDKRVREDYVIPTLFRLVKTEKLDRLLNCYQTLSGGHGIMRTGLVDTPNKVEEFIEAARRLNHELGRALPSKERPLKIASHQLNSPEREEMVIRDQHIFLLKRDQDRGDVEIAHINTPCNCYYEHTQVYGEQLFPGEKKSREQNIEGLATYFLWVASDLEKMQDNPEYSTRQQRGIQRATGLMRGANDREYIYSLRNQIYENCRQAANIRVELEQEKSFLTKQIEELRKDLASYQCQDSLIGKYKTLETIEKDVLSNDPAFKGIREACFLLRKIFANQLDIEGVPESEKMSRGQEIMCFQLLNRRLGVISAVNCKSGLDRAGFVFGLIMALMQLPEEQIFSLVAEWDYYARELNLRIKKMGYDLDKFYGWLEESEMSTYKNRLRIVAEVRRRVMENIIHVSLPITGISSGFLGLKWGKGMCRNRIPLNFIPAVIQVVKGNGNVEKEQILEYDDDGKPEKLTKMGRSLLTQHSRRRGT